MDIVHIGCGNSNYLSKDVTTDPFIKLIEENKGLDILLVDANPFVVKVLREKCSGLSYYNKMRFLNKAVLPVDTNFPVKFFIPVDEKLSDCGSVNPVHVVAHAHNDKMYELNIDSISLNTLLEKYTSKNIKYLIIDLEGLDALALFSLNYDNFNIENIIFEFIHTDGIVRSGIKLQTIINMLKEYGYYTKRYDEYNMIATKT
jgi:hypothetical protein